MAGKRKRSTRLSGTNLESLSLYTFYLDRALESFLVRDALASAGARVQLHWEHFADDAHDVDWLPVISRRGWVILSKDEYNALEIRSIRNAGGRAFLLVRANLKGEEMAEVVRKALPAMLRFLDLMKPPFVAKIYRDGSVAMTDYIPSSPKETPSP